MPLIPENEVPVAPRAPSGVTPPNPLRPSAGDVLAAAFRQDNPLVNVASRLFEERYPAVPGHNPMTTIAGTEFEQRHANRFIGSNSPDEDFAIIRRIAEEDADRKTLDAAGFAGTVAQLGTELVNPVNFLPAGAIVRGARGGFSLARSAASVGAAGAGATAISEGLLQATQETRTLGESATAIASSAILSGLIGTGAASLLSRAERRSLEQVIDRTRADYAFRDGNTKEAFDHLASAGDVAAHGPASVDEQGFMAFHGSPHDFDRFDMSKINTGAAAQSFGHGLYFAEADAVARDYASRFAKDNSFAEVSNAAWKDPELGPRLKTDMERMQALGQQLARTDESAANFSALSAEYDAAARAWKAIAAEAAERFPASTLYRVRIKVDRDHFLDWDKPLAEQSQPVQEALRRAGFDIGNDRAATGQRIYEQAGSRAADVEPGSAGWAVGAGKPEAAAILREAGIPGIKYLDQGSRSAGEGSRNYVVFNDKLIEIVDKNGVPVARPEPPPAPAQPSGTAASAGAAAADTRALELERSGLGATAALSPTRRVFSSASTAARRAMADLAESPYRFQGDEVPTSLGGPALDRLARMEINGARVEIGDGLERLFAEYRFGDPEKTMPRLKARFEDFTGAAPDRMTYDQFKNEVSRALIEGDRHSVPQVEQAAQLIRARVFEPWKERAIAAGLLPEGVETKTAASYFQRVYNKERIRAERPAFVNKVVDWLKSDQRTKAAAKERITALNDELQGFEAAIAKANSEESAAALMLRRDAVRAKIEEEIAAWEGKSVAEAKSAMKAREQYEAERLARATEAGEAPPTSRLAQADAAIDRAVKKIIESDRNLDDAELRDRAHEITERILGSPDGRLPYDIPMGGPAIGWRGAAAPARGPLAVREFNIPDAVIRDFLEQDVESVVQTHLRTIVPDVLLTERFGDVRMTEALKKVEEDYARLTDAATSQKERVRLGKERDAVIRDLAAVRDRVRGVYGWSPELRNMARVATGAKSVNNITSMGVSAISSLPDFAGAALRWGMTNTFQDGWAPFFKAMTSDHEGWTKFKSQMRAVGIGIEVATNARQHALDDVTDLYKPGSQFERGLQMVNDRFFIANLLAPLTDVQKTIAAHVSVSEILRASKAAADGKATQKQLANLAESGIDQNMAGRIWSQFQNGGEVVDGVHLPNTADWTDKAAADALNGAVGREVDIAVVTPGQERPLWMSHPVMSVLGQFKSFTAAATERILVANLMRRDAHALSGLMMAVGLGMLSYKLNSFFGGQETSKRPQDWLKEGISRSGVLGWFEEGNAMASKMTRGGVDIYRMIGADKPLSRFASRSTLDMLLGPTAGKLGGLFKVTGAAASGDWTESDTTALRRLMAFQNLFYLRGLLNQAEGGFNSMLSVPPRAERPN